MESIGRFLITMGAVVFGNAAYDGIKHGAKKELAKRARAKAFAALPEHEQNAQKLEVLRKWGVPEQAAATMMGQDKYEAAAAFLDSKIAIVPDPEPES